MNLKDNPGKTSELLLLGGEAWMVTPRPQHQYLLLTQLSISLYMFVVDLREY
jgi:hypothetical protein